MPISHRGLRDGSTKETSWKTAGHLRGLRAPWAGEGGAEVKACVGINVAEASGNPLCMPRGPESQRLSKALTCEQLSELWSHVAPGRHTNFISFAQSGLREGLQGSGRTQ